MGSLMSAPTIPGLGPDPLVHLGQNLARPHDLINPGLESLLTYLRAIFMSMFSKVTVVFSVWSLITLDAIYAIMDGYSAVTSIENPTNGIP